MTDPASAIFTLSIGAALYSCGAAMIGLWWSSPPKYITIPARAYYDAMESTFDVRIVGAFEDGTKDADEDREPSRIEIVKQAYVTGKMDDREFEQRVGEAVEHDELSKEQR